MEQNYNIRSITDKSRVHFEAHKGESDFYNMLLDITGLIPGSAGHICKATAVLDSYISKKQVNEYQSTGSEPAIDDILSECVIGNSGTLMLSGNGSILVDIVFNDGFKMRVSADSLGLEPAEAFPGDPARDRFRE